MSLPMKMATSPIFRQTLCINRLVDISHSLSLCVCVILNVYMQIIYIYSKNVPWYPHIRWFPCGKTSAIWPSSLRSKSQHWLQTGASAGHRFQPFHLAVQVIEGRHGGGRFWHRENWSQRKWHTRCCKQYSRDTITITKLGGKDCFWSELGRY